MLTNPWLRVCRLAGLPFREDQSAWKSQPPDALDRPIMKITIYLRALEPTSCQLARTTSLANILHEHRLASHFHAALQACCAAICCAAITHFCAVHCDSCTAGPSHSDEAPPSRCSQQARAADQHLLAHMPAECLHRTAKVGTVRVLMRQRPCHLRASCSDLQLSRLTDHILTRGPSPALVLNYPGHTTREKAPGLDFSLR